MEHCTMHDTIKLPGMALDPLGGFAKCAAGELAQATGGGQPKHQGQHRRVTSTSMSTALRVCLPMEQCNWCRNFPLM